MIKSFFEYYKPHKGLFLADFGSAVILGIFELAFPIAVIWFLDKLLPTGNWTLIISIGVGLLALYCFNAALTYIVNYWGHMLGIKIETEMRRKCFEHLQKLSFSFYDSQKTGHLIARTTKDLEQIGELAHHGPEDVFMAIMTFIGAFILMLYTNVELAMMIILIVPLVVFATSRYGIKFESNWRKIFTKIGIFNERIEENIGGIRVVQSFANETYEKQRFAVENEQYKDLKLEGYKYMAASASIFYASTRIIQLLVMIVGSYLVIANQLTHGQFVGFLLLVAVFVRPIEKISGILESYTNGIAGFRRYKDFLAIEADITDLPNAQKFGQPRDNIQFQNVDFSYDTGERVLHNINLTIPIGKTTAFVGPSGAGKTTICSLIPRFYDTTIGQVTFDGVNIRDFTLESLRKQIGVVQQDTFLFGGTLAENIAYGDLTASEEQILEAAHKARLTSVIEQLPEGLNTMVGERGVKLSGGQKQRVAIARIFLKNPYILILDEATSSLDSITEEEIQKSLIELSAGRTTIIIAHRLATVRQADQIIVVEDHKVIETGSHNDLLAQNGAYAKLINAQNQILE